MVREGTRRLLDAELDLTVVGEAADADQAVRLGSQGEVICSDMNGFFYEQTMRGYTYLGSE